MTFPILTLCTHPGCPQIVSERGKSKCPAHYTEANKHYNRNYRNRPDKKTESRSSTELGYGYDWQQVRNRALARDNYLCQECLEKDDRMIPAEHVDHIEAFHGKRDKRRLDLKNLRSLCQPCHSKKTIRDDGGFGHLPKKVEVEQPAPAQTPTEELSQADRFRPKWKFD